MDMVTVPVLSSRLVCEECLAETLKTSSARSRDPFWTVFGQQGAVGQLADENLNSERSDAAHHVRPRGRSPCLVRLDHGEPPRLELRGLLQEPFERCQGAGAVRASCWLLVHGCSTRHLQVYEGAG